MFSMSRIGRNAHVEPRARRDNNQTLEAKTLMSGKRGPLKRSYPILTLSHTFLYSGRRLAVNSYHPNWLAAIHKPTLSSSIRLKIIKVNNNNISLKTDQLPSV